jgi:hypothetical protein
MRIKLLSQDKLFNIATIGSIFCVIIASSALELKVAADIAAPIIFFVLSAMNRVTFDNGIFFNNSGDELSHKLPTKFGQWTGMVVLITFIGGFIGIVPFGYNLFASVFAIILSYFMFTNCPISILLSEDAWKSAKAVFGIKPTPQDSTDTLYNRMYNPKYLNLPYNIYHDR